MNNSTWVWAVAFVGDVDSGSLILQLCQPRAGPSLAWFSTHQRCFPALVVLHREEDLSLRALVSRHIRGAFYTSINAIMKRDKKASLGITAFQAQPGETERSAGDRPPKCGERPNFILALAAFAACTGLFRLLKARKHFGLLARTLIPVERSSVQEKEIVSGKTLGLKSNGKSEAEWIKLLTCCATQVKHLNKWNKPMIIIVEISGVNKLYLYANFSTDSEQVKA